MIQVVVLIGNICSGKSTFASLLGNKGFRFFPIEELKKKMNLEEKAYDKNQETLYDEYARQIINLGKENLKLIVESTGGNKSWPQCLQKLKAAFGSKLVVIKINASKEICLTRLKQNKTGHRTNTREDLIDIIDKRLSEYISADIALDNNGTREEFLEKANQAISKIINS